MYCSSSDPVCPLISLVLGVYYFLKDGAGDFSESAHVLSPCSEYKVLRGTGGDRGFQYVPFFWEQFPDLHWGNDNRSCAGGSGILRNREISF